MQRYGVLVLEIIRHGDSLKMSLYERTQISPTLKHFSQHHVSFKEIDNFCREIISILNSSDTSGELRDPVSLKELAKIGQLLWEHLFTASVKKTLINTNFADLVLQIDEELVHIPWELLYNGKNFLCLVFNLGRVVRTARQIFASSYRGHGSFLKMLVLANPTADLKSAYLEGLNIKNQFDHRRDRVHIDFKSTYIERLYVKKHIHDYDLVHFAGHCEYEENDIENSGWVLSDGKFTIHDITTMAGTAEYPSLIFSNGCCSAKSKDIFLEGDYQEKNYNLASAFLFSGVRHYIGSIRRISDSESFLFAKEFYNQILSGKSIGEALRLSRLNLIKENGITDIHWLSYLLYGDPSFGFFAARVKRRAGFRFKHVLSFLK
ncbi:MAG: CHAT domain-containing protein, partial [Candidatus Omnitrophica bacterium]|nr:CHAT domain-containing protein [Candidatus Omnitrophota bacterium]